MKIITGSEEQTVAVARDLAQDLAKDPERRRVLFLHGALGAGKTVFARALIRALADDPGLEVPSPTFTLLQTYDTPGGPVSHYDLYRLEGAQDIHELGWDDSLSAGITIVEWPERLGRLAPRGRLDIRLANVKNEPDKREIEITLVE